MADADSSSSFDSQLWAEGVEFEAPNGDVVRFVPTKRDGELAEYLCVAGGDSWSHVGWATQLSYSPNTQTLADQTGGGGKLPSEGLEELLVALRGLCQYRNVDCHIPLGAAGSWQNVHRASSSNSASSILPPPSHDERDESGSMLGTLAAEDLSDYVEFTVPTGDRVRFAATDREGEVAEFTQSGGGGQWQLQGFATELRYDHAAGVISDQHGGGGPLPANRKQQLAADLQELCVRAGIPFRRSPVGARAAPKDPRRTPQSTGSSDRLRRRRSAEFRGVRALIIGSTGGGVGVAACSRGCQQMTAVLQRDAGAARIRVVCEGGPTEPTRRAVLEELTRLAAGVRPGDSLFLGLVCKGHPLRRPVRGQVGAAEGILCSDGLAVTSHEVRATLVDALPAGAWLCVVCDCSPAASVLDLPYKLVAAADGFHFGESSAASDIRPAVVQLSLAQATAPAPRSGEAGSLSAVLRSALDRAAPPTYIELVDALRQLLPGLAPMISSAHTFDASTDCFSVAGLCPPRGADVASGDEALRFFANFDSGDERRFWRDFVRAFDALESKQERSAARAPDTALIGAPLGIGAGRDPPQPNGTGPPLEQLVRGFYLRHAPEKRRLAATLVAEFPGRALELLQMLARKYDDPSVLKVYDPRWDLPQPGVSATGGPHLRPAPAATSNDRVSPPRPQRSQKLRSSALRGGLSAVGRRDAWDII
eukprot:TRINITY_DN21144_c0_g1_i3.p1 TRINITY_DN21144_c0_g1~~TRINITY_DN21144_c0_g1_i3.p1  ORF type:complete len:726 (+),score=214.30 TRINITY_DN21144_c0_g1_i3:60-2180(+)